MSVCLRCGKQLGLNAKFCGSCGYQVKGQQTATDNQAENIASFQTKTIVCLRCGKQLQKTDKFCGECGYPNQSQVPHQQTTSNSTNNSCPSIIGSREELIAEIDRMLMYFSKVQDLYDELDRCVDIRNAEQDKIDREIRRRRYNDGDIFDFLEFLFGFTGELITRDYDALATRFLIFCIFFSIAGVVVFLAKISKYFIFIAIGCFLFSGLLCYFSVFCKMKYKRIKREERNHYDSVLAELKEYHKKYGYCIVTFVNANPRILNRVRGYLVSGQAYTLKDALKLACN